MRQPPMYFRLGGGTLCGISKPGEIVWSRFFIEDGKLKLDIGRGKAIKLPTKAAELDPMLDAYIAKYGDKVNAEVDRRMAEAQTIKAESEDFDLQSLLA